MHGIVSFPNTSDTTCIMKKWISNWLFSLSASRYLQFDVIFGSEHQNLATFHQMFIVWLDTIRVPLTNTIIKIVITFRYSKLKHFTFTAFQGATIQWIVHSLLCLRISEFITYANQINFKSQPKHCWYKSACSSAIEKVITHHSHSPKRCCEKLTADGIVLNNKREHIRLTKWRFMVDHCMEIVCV